MRRNKYCKYQKGGDIDFSFVKPSVTSKNMDQQLKLNNAKNARMAAREVQINNLTGGARSIDVPMFPGAPLESQKNLKLVIQSNIQAREFSKYDNTIKGGGKRTRRRKSRRRKSRRRKSRRRKSHRRKSRRRRK